MSAAARLHHVGIAVTDLERSLAFYRDVIGLALLAIGAESSPLYARMLGVDSVSFRWAELDVGAGQVLELLQYSAPHAALTTAPNAAPHVVPTPPTGPHIAVAIPDADDLYRRLLRNRIVVLSPPQELEENNHWLGLRVFYARDPDNNLIEFVQ